MSADTSPEKILKTVESNGTGTARSVCGKFVRGRRGFDRGHGGFNRGRLGFARGHGPFKRVRRVKRVRDVKTLQEVLLSVRSLPVFSLKEKLQDGLGEFEGWSVIDLLKVLNHAHYASFRKKFEKKFEKQYSKDRIGEVPRVRLYYKLIESLSPPTLQESLNCSLQFLCKKLQLKYLTNDHPEWPDFESNHPLSILKEGIVSALGECEVPVKSLWNRLEKWEKNIMFCEAQDRWMNSFRSAAAFFKKYPESFPWKDKVIEETVIEDNVMEDVRTFNE